MPRHRGNSGGPIDLTDETELATNDLQIHPSPYRSRNLLGFWLLGLCNNFAYVIMLSAAKDILEPKNPDSDFGNSTECREIIDSRTCQPLSTGSVLLADILPALLVKITAPLYIHRIPFGLRHCVTVCLQASSLLVVAMSSTVPMALLGVVLTSLGSGLGEVTYLALTSHFDSQVIGFWSSGTGGAGIFGALAYAVLTESKLLGFSPSNTLLFMLVIPVIFAITYWQIIHIPHKVHKVQVTNIHTYLVRDPVAQARAIDTDPLLENEGFDQVESHSFEKKKTLIQSLLKYMVPLVLVYFGEYFINQGISELLEFDCSHGLGLSPSAQYRWYQVIYQLGVFFSRSSSKYITIPTNILPVLAVLQLLNAGLFLLDARMPFIPHIGIIFVLIVYEGLLGGASYVNTFRAIHDEISPLDREFSMGFVSISDTLGIVLSGFLAIPVHNFICNTPYAPIV